MTKETTFPKPFRSQLGYTIFKEKYSHEGAETWELLCEKLVRRVCDKLPKSDQDELIQIMSNMEFIPGGRYLYYANRPVSFFNNCYLLKADEDTREDWAYLSWKAESCLITGGGIGVDYSIYRPSGSPISRTGGVASGPIPKMMMINEIGRNVMQGGARRSALYASLRHSHSDINEFLEVKDWDNQKVAGTDATIGDLVRANFAYNAPLSCTNISVNYDTAWIENFKKTGDVGEVFKKNVRMALRNGEPGFSFNFYDKENETLRNACTEVSSSDDSDVCNLGSINLARINDKDHFRRVVELSTKFLLCGTLKADLPYKKIYEVREKNRRLGLGLMGVHEWLMKKSKRYEVDDELHQWLSIYKSTSEETGRTTADAFGISRPVAYRAIAPTGTIGILAGTSTGIEPIFAIAYKRRYLTEGKRWKYQYHVDHIANELIKEYGLDPTKIETASDLARDYERRIAFQADIQDYVDMSISSTINLPAWDPIDPSVDADTFGNTLARYAHRLRGFTVYPDGARGGQPLVPMDYNEVRHKLGEEFEESSEVNDVCSLNGGGVCGV